MAVSLLNKFLILKSAVQASVATYLVTKASDKMSLKVCSLWT
jgi:hypothetical protein